MKLNLISERGDILPLIDNPFFDLTNIYGQTQFNAALSSTTVGGLDGDSITNIQAQPRQIIFDLKIKNNVNVEEAKRNVLSYIKPKQAVRLEWEQNERNLTISGKVEIIDMPRWNNSVTMQVTLYCEQPYWEDVEFVVQEISEAINLHYFTTTSSDMLYFEEGGIAFGEIDTMRTKTFFNKGDVPVGMEITITALDTVTNPIIRDKNGNYFGVGYVWYEEELTGGVIWETMYEKPLVLQAGDIVKITTHKGNKGVKLNGRDIFDYIMPNSTWLQLESGENQFSIDSDDESIANMYFNLEYKQRYI